MVGERSRSPTLTVSSNENLLLHYHNTPPSSPPPTYQRVLEETREACSSSRRLVKQSSVDSSTLSDERQPIFSENLQGCSNEAYQDHQEPSTSYDASSRQFDESSSVTTLTMCQYDDDDDDDNEGEEEDNDDDDDDQDDGRGDDNNDEDDDNKSRSSPTHMYNDLLDDRRLDDSIQYNCKMNAISQPIQQKSIEVANKTSKEMYLAMAKEMGIECRMSDQCRCFDCQAGYLDCADENIKTDGGLGAGTPMFVSEAFGHGMAPACCIL